MASCTLCLHAGSANHRQATLDSKLQCVLCHFEPRPAAIVQRTSYHLSNNYGSGDLQARHPQPAPFLPGSYPNVQSASLPAWHQVSQTHHFDSSHHPNAHATLAHSVRTTIGNKVGLKFVLTGSGVLRGSEFEPARFPWPAQSSILRKTQSWPSHSAHSPPANRPEEVLRGVEAFGCKGLPGAGARCPRPRIISYFSWFQLKPPNVQVDQGARPIFRNCKLLVVEPLLEQLAT